MASSSRNTAALGQSFAAGHSFQPDVRTQLEKADDEFRKLKGRLAALRNGAPPGKDSATMAGYDPQRRNKTTALLKEIDITFKEANRLESDIELTKTSIAAYQSTSLTGIDVQDQEARKRASSRVVDFIAGTSDNTRVFFSGLGVKVTPATDDTVRRALKELPVSNANPVNQESHSAKELASVKKAVDQNRKLLDEANKKCNDYKLAWTKAKKYCDELAKASDQQSRELLQAKRDLSNAKKELSEADRDKANRDMAYVKVQCYKAEERVKRRDSSIDELKKKNKELDDDLMRLRGDLDNRNNDLAHEEKEHGYLKENFKLSEKSASTAKAEVRRLQSELDASRDGHLNEMRLLRTEKDEADERAEQVSRELQAAQHSLAETRKELGDTQIAHSTDTVSLNSVREEVSKVRSDCRSLQRTVEEQRQSLEDKNRKIRELEEASRQKDSSITQRDGTINSQIQKASTFLRHLSLNVKSDAWKHIAENVLVDSTSTFTTSAEWLPWVIFPSWSGDASLATREDTRSPEAVALDILAILDVKSTDNKDLLALLHHLQEAMKEFKSMVSAITLLLLRAFANAVGDPRLHLMHRFAMCQIANLLGPTAEVQQFMQALGAADPRIQRLVDALRAYRLNRSVLPMEEAVSYPAVALVGFNRDPRGVIAVSLSDNGICWVDSTHIKTEFTLLKVVSGKGDSIELPLDTTERVNWAIVHA